MPGEGSRGLLGRIRGNDQISTFENVCMVVIVVGSIVLSVGIGMTAISPRGIPAALSMSGAVITFMGTALLILTWVVGEILGGRK
jgi:hypothetical protein